MIHIKRAYEEPEQDDGCRILIDRLWPRGLSKEKLKIDLWLKEIAPSSELRKLFSHDLQKWDEFRAKYRDELKEKMDLLSIIKQKEQEQGNLTLIYAARDKEHNNAVVLLDALTKGN